MKFLREIVNNKFRQLEMIHRRQHNSMTNTYTIQGGRRQHTTSKSTDNSFKLTHMYNVCVTRTMSTDQKADGRGNRRARPLMFIAR